MEFTSIVKASTMYRNQRGAVFVYLAIISVMLITFLAVALDLARLNTAVTKSETATVAAAQLAVRTYLTSAPTVVSSESDHVAKMTIVSAKVKELFNDYLNSSGGTADGLVADDLSNLSLIPGTYFATRPPECSSSRGPVWCRLCPAGRAEDDYQCFIPFQWGRFEYGVNSFRIALTSRSDSPLRFIFGKITGVDHEIFTVRSMAAQPARLFLFMLDTSESMIRATHPKFGREQAVYNVPLPVGESCVTGGSSYRSNCDMNGNSLELGEARGPCRNVDPAFDPIWYSDLYFNDPAWCDARNQSNACGSPTPLPRHGYMCPWNDPIYRPDMDKSFERYTGSNWNDTCLSSPSWIPSFGIAGNPDHWGAMSWWPVNADRAPVNTNWAYIGDTRGVGSSGLFPRRRFKSDYGCESVNLLTLSKLDNLSGKFVDSIDSIPARDYLVEDPNKVRVSDKKDPNYLEFKDYQGPQPLTDTLKALYRVWWELRAQRIPGDRMGIVTFNQRIGPTTLAVNLSPLSDPKLEIIMKAINSDLGQSSPTEIMNLARIGERFDLGLFPDDRFAGTALPTALATGLYHIKKTAGYKSAASYLIMMSDLLATHGCDLTARGSPSPALSDGELESCRTHASYIEDDDIRVVGLAPQDRNGERYRYAINDVVGDGLILDSIREAGVRPVFLVFNGAAGGEFLYKHPTLDRCATREETIASGKPLTPGGQGLSLQWIRREFNHADVVADPGTTFSLYSSVIARKAIAYGGDFVQLQRPCALSEAEQPEIDQRIENLCKKYGGDGSVPLNLSDLTSGCDWIGEFARRPRGVNFISTYFNPTRERSGNDFFSFAGGLHLRRVANTWCSKGILGGDQPMAGTPNDGCAALWDYNWVAKQFTTKLPPIDIVTRTDANFGAVLRCDRESRGVEQQIVDTVSELFKPTAARIVPWIDQGNVKLPPGDGKGTESR